MKVSMKKAISSLTIGAILVSSAALFTADAATLSRQYTKYVYATGATSTYTLSMDETAAVNSDFFLDGVDNRFNETRSENDGIVQLRLNGTSIGTGFIVDDHTIATAAHCLYDSSGFITNTKVYLYNEDGTKTGEVLTAIEAHVPTGRITHCANGTENTTAGLAYDYGLITVAEDLSDHTYFSFNDIYDINNSDLSNVNVYVSGIPGSVEVPGEDPSNSEDLIYTGVGTIIQKTTTDFPVIYFTTDISGGQSGAPVYLIEKFTVGTNTYYNYAVVGILHGGYPTVHNSGARVNSYLLQFYGSANTNLSY